MNVGSALKLTCVGIAGGTVLRLIDMLYFFDYETGFFENHAIFSWITFAFVMVISLLAMIMCYRDKKSFFGPFVARRNYFVAVTAAASSAMLIIMCILQAFQHINHVEQNWVGRNYAQSSVMHIIFIVVTAIFALVQIVAMVGSVMGKNFFIRARLLYILAPVWGVSNLLFTFFYYGKSTATTENIYTIVGIALLLLSLLYLSMLLAGIGGEKSAKRFYMFGIPAVTLNFTYTASNAMLALLGKNYDGFGELPMPVQLANLSVSLFVLAFLFTFKKYSLKRKNRMNPEERAAAERQSQHRYNPKTSANTAKNGESAMPGTAVNQGDKNI